MKTATLRLTIEVTYKLNGETTETLQAILEDIPYSAAEQVLFSGDSKAKVADWRSTVGVVRVSK